MKKIRNFFEGIFVYIFYYLFKLLSFESASNLGSILARFIGPKLKVNKVAVKNLKFAMPELSEQEISRIATGMWDNLGRTVGELPHMQTLVGKNFAERVTIDGLENFENAKKRGKGFIFFSGHFANWEIGPRASAEMGYPLALVYRPANNNMVETIIQNSRKGSHAGMFPKGKEAARYILAHLKKNGQAGMLVDQKMNDGVSVNFFKKRAMTAPALAEFGLKFDVPLLPARIERVDNTYFVATIYPAMDIKGKNTKEIMAEVNDMFEGWIRERPEQWFWLHKRWPES